MRLICSLLISFLFFTSKVYTFNLKYLTCIAGFTALATYIHTPKQIQPTPETLNVFTVYPIQKEKSDHIYSMADMMTALAHNNTPSKAYIQLNTKKTQNISKTRKILGYLPTYNTVNVANESYVTMVIRGTARGSWGFPLFSKGRARKGGGLVTTYGWIRNNLIHTPAICCDFVDQLKSFNLGQSLDQQYIDTLYKQIEAQAPHTSITLISDCLGSLRLLNYIELYKPKNIDTIVLFSPFVSLDALVESTCYSYFRSLVKNFLEFVLPNYDNKKDTLLDNVKNIKGKTIFIAQRRNEYLTSNNHVAQLVKALNKHNTVYVHITDDTTHYHSRLSSVKDVQVTLNAFYAEQNMPHDELLAQEGKELLLKAHYYGENPNAI